MRILITGATGFIGSALVGTLIRSNKYAIRLALRKGGHTPIRDVEYCIVRDLGPDTVWQQALNGIETVVHLAARVHVMKESSADPAAEYSHTNVEGTWNLARQAVAAGVRRFIFLSSIKVNGDRTAPDRPFEADDSPAPKGPYAVSKLKAEEGVQRLTTGTDMSAVIIRPPLVYGAGVKGNFFTMMRCLSSGIPIPLGAIQNRRSLIALDNLVDLIIRCIEHPAAVNQIFLASDGEDLSTTELLQRLGMHLGKPARLIPIPSAAIDIVARLLRKKDFAHRLLDSLQVDITKNRRMLDWEPPFTVDQGLEATARWYVNQTPN